MKSEDLIQLNKFSKLHNDQSIWFCKTDYIYKDFQAISRLDHNVILITGNSDYPITETIVEKKPKNIIKWFAQNALSNFLEPIPIGLENKLEASRHGHGIGYRHRVEQTELEIIEQPEVSPRFNIYANFNVNTNPSFRKNIKNICINSKHINWQEPNLSISKWFNNIRDHRMVVCPMGNGIDTHRLWETLYCNRVPIIVKTAQYKIYDLYLKFPIIVLEDTNELEDEKHINALYSQTLKKSHNIDMLNINYWINLIRESAALC